MIHRITLANVGYPSLVCEVDVEAKSREQAEDLALKLDFEEQDWQDDLGRSVPWNDVTEEHVVIAHNSKHDA